MDKTHISYLLDKPERLSTNSYKGDNFYDFLFFVFCTIIPFCEEAYSKRKGFVPLICSFLVYSNREELASRGSKFFTSDLTKMNKFCPFGVTGNKFFSFRVDQKEIGGKIILTGLRPYHFFNEP